MNILVTGGTGFIGSWCVRYLLSRGHTCRVPTRSGQYRRLEPLDNLDLVAGDLNDKNFTPALFEGTPIDAVIHLAWDGVLSDGRNNEALQKENYKTTLRLIEDAADAGVKTFIGLGSQAEYGILNRRIVETDKPDPQTMYGRYKLKACIDGIEKAKLKEMNFAWLRLFSTFGPRDNDGYIIPFVIKSFLRGEQPELTDCTQAWDYLYVEDIPPLIERVLGSEKKFRDVYNLCSGSAIPLREVILILRDLTHAKVEPGFGKLEHRPDGLMHLEGDNEKFRAAFGWIDLIEINHGLHNTVAYFREEFEKAQS